jgi:hypothetical protein
MLTPTMKQRITYVVKNPDTFTPDLLEVTKDGPKDSFVVNGVQAAKEHRITLGLDELPTEVSTSEVFLRTSNNYADYW